MQGWARLQAERTWNMRTMFLTLDVSKLSGRLNFHASCRESKGGHAMRGEVRAGGWEAERDRGARSVQGRARLQVGGPGTGERTWNMRSMVVTLEVSKLSGWLNFHASCRESNGGYTRGRDAGRGVGGPRATAVQAACRGLDRLQTGSPGTGRSALGTCAPCF